MSWEIGKLINEYLLHNGKAEYGNELFIKLEKDLEIDSKVLYRMSKFYKTYPQIPEENNLNWTHYRLLTEIKDDEKRKYLEKLAIENNLNSVELEKKIKKEKNSLCETKNDDKNVEIQNFLPLLKPSRGIVFHYTLKKIENFGTQKMYLDLGFNILKTIETNLTETEIIVSVSKTQDKFLLKKSDIKHKQLNTYKAFVEKIVDGDTLVVIFDLGFGIFHKEIIRLNGINAPEISTDAGKKSKDELSKILDTKNIKFVIIKTLKTDIFGRYVADVFFDKNLQDIQEIANTGEYLNQILMDKELAKRMII